MVSDYRVSGKKGSFSPTEAKPAAVETPKKSAGPQLTANKIKQATSHDAVDSAEPKIVNKSDSDDKEKSPVKYIARRKAPPPPKGAKKNTAVPSSQPEPNATLSHRDQPHFAAHAKRPPGSPGKRPAPGVPTGAKQPTGEKHLSKQMSDSVLTKHQPPPSPLKRTLQTMTEDISDHQVAAPSTLAAKKKRPAPTRPAPTFPTLPNSHSRHTSESSGKCRRCLPI